MPWSHRRGLALQAGVGQRCRGALDVGLARGHVSLERLALDPKQQVAGLDHRALVEGALGEEALDPGDEVDGVDGLDAAHEFHRRRDLALAYRRHTDSRRRWRGTGIDCLLTGLAAGQADRGE